MKKNLIALAVLAASGAAMAQSSVTLYGILDVLGGRLTVENKNNVATPSLSTTKMDTGTVNGTRWGLRGSEDLGGGLNAIFDLQSGFDISTGGSQQGGTLFGRQAVVGFQGAFGTVKFGRVITPFFENESGNDVMMGSSLSPQSNVMRTSNNWSSAGNNGTNAAFETSSLAGYTLRGNNAIRYDTPTIGGFVGQIAYAMDESTQSTLPQGNTTQPAVTSAALLYSAGPVNGVLAYQIEKPYQPLGVGAAGTVYAGTNASDRSFLRLSGQYDFGKIIAKAGYGRAERVNFMQDGKTNEYQIGLDYKVSDVMTLTGGIASSKDDASTSNANIEVKRTAYALGGKYVMSKRTFLYGGYESGKQEKAGSPDATESFLAFGLQHRF
ncbi:porin [Rhodoferax sp.]|uniref:porin n=1 Tax=Rhodoferax sp. TaxID=50421 RepID=UPI002634F11F|nr:porin [Rhodoferax sp.]MDD2919674.1 porin [Rhodoferax sp.]